MARAIHTMIRVLDPERSMRFYEQAFGLEPRERADFDDFSLIYLGNDESDFELELTWNHGASEPYSHGSGYGHLAVRVDDLEAEHRRLTNAGLEPGSIVAMCHGGQAFARLFFVKDPDGYSIEILEGSGRFA